MVLSKKHRQLRTGGVSYFLCKITCLCRKLYCQCLEKERLLDKMHAHGYHYGVAKSSQDYIILFAERVMDIKKLEVFINAVDLGSLTKVAEIMGYTQSGITHVISALEKEMGFPLLLRSRNGVVPTPEGARLIPSIRAMLVHSGQLEKEISPRCRLHQYAHALAAADCQAFS